MNKLICAIFLTVMVNVYGGDQSELLSLTITPAVPDFELKVLNLHEYSEGKGGDSVAVAVVGAINSPGVYHFAGNVNDLIKKSGGFSKDAMQSRIIITNRKMGQVWTFISNSKERGLAVNIFDRWVLRDGDIVFISAVAP